MNIHSFDEIRGYITGKSMLVFQIQSNIKYYLSNGNEDYSNRGKKLREFQRTQNCFWRNIYLYKYIITKRYFYFCC